MLVHAYAYRDGMVITSPRKIKGPVLLASDDKDRLEAGLDKVLGPRQFGEGYPWRCEIYSGTPPAGREIEIDRVRRELARALEDFQQRQAQATAALWAPRISVKE